VKLGFEGGGDGAKQTEHQPYRSAPACISPRMFEIPTRTWPTGQASRPRCLWHWAS